MIAKIKHGLQEWMNGILLFLVLLGLPVFITHQLTILIMMNIELNILIKILIWGALLIIELIILFILDGFFSSIGECCINKILSMCKKNGEKHKGDSNEYSAVLIGNNLSCYKNIITNSGACGLYFLNQYFKSNNKRCKIRQKVNKSDFDEFVLDTDCQELYILGHGSKKSFRIKNGINDIDYSEYKGKAKQSKKELLLNYIVQVQKLEMRV